jgi:hypothetical protein
LNFMQAMLSMQQMYFSLMLWFILNTSDETAPILLTNLMHLMFQSRAQPLMTYLKTTMSKESKDRVRSARVGNTVAVRQQNATEEEV